MKPNGNIRKQKQGERENKSVLNKLCSVIFTHINKPVGDDCLFALVIGLRTWHLILFSKATMNLMDAPISTSIQ
jgi:hypothetical protein